MSRKSSVVDPKKAYCDNRYFVCADWAHVGIRQRRHVLGPEKEMLATLQRRAGAGLNVSAFDFNLLTFDEQLRQVVAADALAGPHGAGLTHLLFLRDGACVFELFIDTLEDLYRYNNLAAWRGLRYGNYVAYHPAPKEIVSRLLAVCFPGLATNKLKFRARAAAAKQG